LQPNAAEEEIVLLVEKQRLTRAELPLFDENWVGRHVSVGVVFQSSLGAFESGLILMQGIPQNLLPKTSSLARRIVFARILRNFGRNGRTSSPQSQLGNNPHRRTENHRHPG